MRRAARTRIEAVAALAAVATAAPAGPARAGTYRVQFCAGAGGVVGNAVWTGSPPVAGIQTDTTCPAAGTRVGLAVPVSATARIADGALARVTFTAPPGTTIADVRLVRRLVLDNVVAAGTHGLYALYALQGVPFYGSGDYDAATVRRLGTLGGWPASVATQSATNTLGSFLALRGYAGTATVLSLEVGCFPRGTPCSHTGGRLLRNVLFGSEVTLSDRTPPAVTVEAFGLLAGGIVAGGEPVRLSASDGSGIDSVQLIDVTTSPPQVVAAEDYDTQLTDARTGCSYRLARPCLNLTAETLTPAAISRGQRRLIVRVTDTGGNATDRGPFVVNVFPPAERGPLNGADATETGRVVVAFAGARRATRTVRLNRRVTVLGRVFNATGVPVAGALVRVLAKDERASSRWRTAATVRTRADGRFTYRTRGRASRALQLA